MDLFPRRGRISFHLAPAEGPAKELRVRTFNGNEDLFELFCFEVELSSEETISPSQAVGQPAILVVGDDTRVFHGMVAMFELQGSTADGALVYYHTRLVPTAWQLGQGENCRVFQNQTVQQIVETLLKEWGLQDKKDFAFSLDPGTKLEPRVYCVQYKESDWSFITRLLEEEGIHYFFVHERAGEDEGPAGWRDKLVITDTPAQHPGVRVPPGHAVDADSGKPSLTVQAPTEQNVAEEHVTHLVARQQVGPTSYTVRDQVFDTPWLLDTQNTKAKGERRPIEVFEYTGAPKSRLTGDLPKLRLEALEVAQLVFEGEASCPGISPGSVFVAADCPLLDTLGEKDHQLLVTSVAHHGVQPQAETTDAGSCQYGNTFVAILSSKPFRPRPRGRRPQILGVQSAKVVGPPNEEIYTDDLGRVKIQFPWDRYGKNNERSSCWVPVAQIWSGSGWGTLFTPRIDQQVLVQFIDGDPDQPLIVGQAYHLHNKPPYELPKRKTVSTIKTDTSPGKKGDGYNEIRFEDRKGAEELYVRAELDRNDLVQRNYSTTVGNDETLNVGHNYTEGVKKDYRQTIEGDKTITLTGKHEETVKKSMKLDVVGPLTETVENARIIKVGKHHETVKGGRKTVVEKGNYEREVKTGNSTLTVAGDVSVTSQQGQGTVVTHGNLELTSEDGECNVSGKTWVALSCSDGQFPRVQLSPNNISLRIGQSTIAMTQDSVTIAMGTNSITLDSQGVTVNGVKITSTAIGVQEISGAMVKIN
jgi:type VI secretion system secreted protein VgrG